MYKRQRDGRTNRTKAYDRPVPDAKEARLDYRLLAESDRYRLLEIELLTGRHHQIRAQLSKIGCPIRGDLKYGAPRSNRDGSISPVSYTHLDVYKRQVGYDPIDAEDHLRRIAPLP